MSTCRYTFCNSLEWPTREESFEIMVVTSSVERSSVELEVLELVSVQILCLHAFFVPGPPKHFKSRQWGHLPQFSRLQPKQVPHRPFEGGRLNFTINQSTV